MNLAAFKYLPKAGGLTKELLLQSLPGAIASGGLTGLMTGDPVAAGTVGLADLFGSTAISRVLGSKRLNQKLAKMGVPNLGLGSPLAGKWLQTRAPREGGVFGPEIYKTSVPQNIGIMGTTFMTPMLVEPMFNKGNVQLAGQKGTTAQQLAQRQNINRSQMTGSLSDGTLFQLAGTPIRADDVRGIY